jgi:S-adenosylmethionine uptake transporter
MTQSQAILTAFAAFAFYAFGDGLIKASSAAADTFTIAFTVTLFAFVPTMFARPKDERWLRMFTMRHPVLTLLRAAAGVSAGLCGFYAFARLPLAEAYTLVFLMPFFVTIMSILFLKEQVRWRRWTALAIGMAGVLMVIRPGFREIELAHLAALGAGMSGAAALVIVRRIGSTEKLTSLMGVSLVAALGVNAVLMIFAGSTAPDAYTLGKLAAAGLLHGAATLMLILASQKIPANRLAPIQYSQLIWGVLIGMAFFAEWPDRWAQAGLVLVAISGLATFLREDRRGFWPQNFRDVRNRFG